MINKGMVKNGISNLDISIYIIPKANAVAINESAQFILFFDSPSDFGFWVGKGLRILFMKGLQNLIEGVCAGFFVGIVISCLL